MHSTYRYRTRVNGRPRVTSRVAAALMSASALASARLAVRRGLLPARQAMGPVGMARAHPMRLPLFSVRPLCAGGEKGGESKDSVESKGGESKGIIDRLGSASVGGQKMAERISSGVGWREALASGLYEQQKAKRDELVVQRLTQLSEMEDFTFDDQRTQYAFDLLSALLSLPTCLQPVPSSLFNLSSPLSNLSSPLAFAGTRRRLRSWRTGSRRRSACASLPTACRAASCPTTSRSRNPTCACGCAS